jgi:hypothetical protein
MLKGMKPLLIAVAPARCSSVPCTSCSLDSCFPAVRDVDRRGAWVGAGAVEWDDGGGSAVLEVVVEEVSATGEVVSAVL